MIIPERIVEEIRQSAVNRANEGMLSPAALDFMYEEKLFKLFVPKELNGRMLPLPEALRVFERASWADGSFGWLVTIGSGGGFFSATLPPEQSKLLFGHDKAVVAGSGHANGIARPVQGGYVVDGQWKYCSGSTYASLFTANCKIEDGSGKNAVIRSFAFLPEQVEIIRDWNAFGLKATESHSIRVTEAFVPVERTFDIMSDPHYDDPIFRYPFLPFAQTSFAAVCLGICRHFLEEARAFATAKLADGTNVRPQHPQRMEKLIRTLGEKETGLQAVADELYETVERTWTEFIKQGSMEDRMEIEIDEICRRLSIDALAYAHAIFPLLGMPVLMEDHALNRIWRDLHTVTQHSVLVHGRD
ncbi:acyl-CoA dehydrogenase [Cohnella lupini]|uniref:Alkylation response protein AidB-like acyl-CoA dehydrogenase n=1 Tax=Cohnella lupini TaxID=1294267 RepID=A0A3D9IS68_9BACL|nr:acyl-CoA dehydrogenase [Cohnella lupini]RED64620.1 alkylation response protein AidB-like acyl-CoA dehydrogenase [Cohnella lupini]